MATIKKVVKKSPPKKKSYEKTLSQLTQGEVVAYAFAHFCKDGLQDIDDNWMQTLDEANTRTDSWSDTLVADDFEAVVEIRIVARRNSQPMIALPQKV